MPGVRDRLEHAFTLLARGVFRHPWAALLLTLGATLPLLTQVPHITIDNRNESLFLEGDPAITAYDAFRDQFGTDEFVVVAATPPDVFDLQFLARLRALHRDLEASVPHLDEVTSLINARSTRGEGDTLIVEELLERWPTTAADLAALRERVLGNPLYLDNLISRDATLTTVIVKPRTLLPVPEGDVLQGFGDTEATPVEPAPGEKYLTSAQHAEMVAVVGEVLARHETPGMPLHMAGMPVLSAAINRAIPRDLAKMMPLSTLLVMVFLGCLFRRASGVICPVITVFLSMAATLGVMAWLGLPMTNVTSMLPSFLTVVGVGDSVHILSVFYLRYDECGDKEAAIAYALGHSGLAILMTSVTTAAGLLSFALADVGPIADLGLVAPIGIGFALVYTVVLLPAFIAIFPLGTRERRAGKGTAAIDRCLDWVARTACGHPIKILLLGGIVALVSLAGIAQLRFSHSGLMWLPETAPVRLATEVIDDRLRGTVALEAVIDTGRRNGLYEPELLRGLERAVAHVEAMRRQDVVVGKAWSLDTIVKEINRALHENRPEHYSIPDDPDLIAQEFLLFEGSGSDDLEEVVDRDFRTVRFTLRVPYRDAIQYVGFIGDVSEYLDQAFPGARVQVTGMMALLVRMIHNVVTTMTKSYLISLCVITALMTVLLGRLRIGVLSMIPNLLPLMAITGIMGWLKIPLDLSTVLIGSIAIGLVVDDTIHFLHNFRRYHDNSGSVERAVAETLHTAGRAILVTSVVLTGGFYICMVAEMRSMMIFGGLMGTTVILALVADYFLTPALMMVAYRRRAPRPETCPGEAM